MMKRIPFLIFFFLPLHLLFAEGPVVEKDLRSEWLVYDNGEYRLFNEDIDSPGNVIYLEINSIRYPNSSLEVISVVPFSIFINGALLRGGLKGIKISLDSVRDNLGASTFLIAVFEAGGINAGVSTTLLIPEAEGVSSAARIVDRVPTYFRDFVILGVCILLLLLILIVGQNPKLATDYFSIRKLFAAPGSQDSLSDNRTTSSSNILFQAFCSVVGGFLVTILFAYLKDSYPIATLVPNRSFSESMVSWLILSGAILALFFLKQLIIYIFAYMFGIKELAVAHYFNFIRLLFWALGLLVSVISIYFIVHGLRVGVFENSYLLIGWTMGFWVLLIFFKLSRRVGFSKFHLFSYLCATEIIPLIITIKVLYY